MIERNAYLNQLINKKENGLIKIITGIRRSGKSYLLGIIFKDFLMKQGIAKDHIINIELDRIENIKYHHNPEQFNQYIKSLVKDSAMYYLLLDEIQLVDNFVFVLNGLLYEKNIDIYVTGSNSKFLSSDIITEFRGRGDQVHIMPLSFSEFLSAYNGSREEAWEEYTTYGGLPLILSFKTATEKFKYLKDLFELTYLKDIIERNKIMRKDILDKLIDILASSVGSLTNPQKLYNTFKSNGEKELSLNTITMYLQKLEESFMVNKALRYDIKGKKYISTPQKYYFSDIGLRNARINFRQQEETHLMENIIYNELLYRGYNVDVGVVEMREADKRRQTEVDFVCNQGSNRYYIQSALFLDTHEKTIHESRPLNNIYDNFRKIIVVKDNKKPWRTDSGILVLGIMDFLLNPDSINL